MKYKLVSINAGKNERILRKNKKAPDRRSILSNDSLSAAGPLFAEADTSAANDARDFCRGYGNRMFAPGVHENGTYNNYAAESAGTGIDTTKEHVFRRTNRITDDSSNMACPDMDDAEAGPLKQYYSGGTGACAGKPRRLRKNRPRSRTAAQWAREALGEMTRPSSAP